MNQFSRHNVLNYAHKSNSIKKVVIEQNADKIAIPINGDETRIERYHKMIDKIVTTQNVHIFRDLSDFEDEEWSEESHGRLDIAEEVKKKFDSS